MLSRERGALSENGHRAEALLSIYAAQRYLEIIYQYPVRGFQQHDRRSLSFFKKIASEKLSRSGSFLGKILLNGWGVTVDVRRG